MKKYSLFFLCLLSCLFASDVTNRIELNGELLTYDVETDFLDLKDNKGNVCAHFFYTSYTKKTAFSEKRPVTFCLNGGPGSSSVWLHMGAFGPRRVQTVEEGQTLSPPYSIITNEETLLDLTDLVFIDPIGTGYSKPAEGIDLKEFCSVESDIKSLSDFIHSYIQSHNRWLSPKYIAGESYGTPRCAAISDYLHKEGIFFNGLVLISTAIDFSYFLDYDNNFLSYASLLPSFAATAWYHQKIDSKISLEEFTNNSFDFAINEYLPALYRGYSLSNSQKNALSEKLSFYTGLSPSTFLKNNLMVNCLDFSCEFFKDKKQLLGLYDTRLTGAKIFKEWTFRQDPSITTIEGVFTAGFNSYMIDELKLQREEKYEILNEDVHNLWDYSFSGPSPFSVFQNLRSALAMNPEMKVFVGSGLYDLVTPFAAAEALFYQLDEPFQKNLTIHRYGGGHMFYLERAAHKTLKEDLKKFYEQQTP